MIWNWPKVIGLWAGNPRQWAVLRANLFMEGDNIIRIIPIKEFFIDRLRVELK